MELACDKIEFKEGFATKPSNRKIWEWFNKKAQVPVKSKSFRIQELQEAKRLAIEKYDAEIAKIMLMPDDIPQSTITIEKAILCIGKEASYADSYRPDETTKALIKFFEKKNFDYAKLHNLTDICNEAGDINVSKVKKWYEELCKNAKIVEVILFWGAISKARNKSYLKKLLNENIPLHCFGLCTKGQPRQPLYNKNFIQKYQLITPELLSSTSFD